MTRKRMMAVVALTAALGVRAATETVGGYTWTNRICGGAAEILV